MYVSPAQGTGKAVFLCLECWMGKGICWTRMWCLKIPKARDEGREQHGLGPRLLESMLIHKDFHVTRSGKASSQWNTPIPLANAVSESEIPGKLTPLSGKADPKTSQEKSQKANSSPWRPSFDRWILQASGDSSWPCERQWRAGRA